MADHLVPTARSALMGRIRGRGNQSTELRMVSLLREGKITGWRRHAKVFGSPDFTWPSSRIALFVDGCFWHGCPIHGHIPKSNLAYWLKKLARNKARDIAVTKELRKRGWKVIRLWECSLSTPRYLLVMRRLKRAVITSAQTTDLIGTNLKKSSRRQKL